MKNAYQLDLTKVKTEAEETRNTLITANSTTTTNIINEKMKTFNITYGKDLSRHITIINHQRNYFKRYF